MNKKESLFALVTITVILCMLLMAGCDNNTTAPPASQQNTPTGQAPQTNPTNNTQANDALKGLTQQAFDELTDILKTAQTYPVFDPSGPAYDIRAALSGKTWLTIPLGTNNQFTLGICTMMQEIGKKIGMDVKIWENQGEVSEWIQGVENAPLLGANIVDLVAGPNPYYMVAQIEYLQSLGIVVQASHFSDVVQDVDHVTTNAGAPYAEGGKLMADWVIHKGGADVNVVILTSDDVPSAKIMCDTIEAEFVKYAPNAKRVYTNIALIDWATKIEIETLTAVQRDKNLDYIIVLYDPMLQFVVPALEMAGVQDKVKCLGYNGTPFVIDWIREGKVEMTVGENLDWIAHAIVDTAGRHLSGLDVPKDTKIPLYIWSVENAKEAGIPAEYSTGYGDVYINGYNQMWMLDK